MTQTQTQPRNTAQRAAVLPFLSILCGIDGSRAAYEAARQAAVMAGSGTLRLLSVTWTEGYGPNAVALLSPWRAERCLARVKQQLRELGVVPYIDIVDDPDATARLLREAEGHDLLVVAGRGHSRAAARTCSTASCSPRTARPALARP
jgi:nucleotide-binding universal stress UspA family protein